MSELNERLPELRRLPNRSPQRPIAVLPEVDLLFPFDG
jgi:hypothetical protein